MRVFLPFLLLAGCSGQEPARPSAADEERFEEMGAMLDAARNEKGAAPEDAAPSVEPEAASAD